MNNLNYIVCDVRTQPTNKTKIIPHCCNDIPAMGAGVAKALSTKWPNVKKQYMFQKGSLGTVQMIPVEFDEDDEPTTYVANMIGQHGVMKRRNEKGIAVGDDGLPPIRYKKLFDCMEKVIKYFRMLHINDPIIHCPKFGADLAGGNWKFIETMIKELWLPKCDVLVCVLDESGIP